MERNFKYITLLMVILSLTAISCKKEFFNRPPEAALTLETFYKNDEQVKASTTALYGTPWFNWNNQVSWAIGDMYSGNARSYSSDVYNYGNFSVTADNNLVVNGWNSLFTVVAQSNAVINNLKSVPSTVSAEVVKNALGEAHLMRALAYFDLVRVWANVPIIENNLDHITDFQLNTNPVADVYKFIVNDLKFAEANCLHMVRSGSSQAQGRVSSGSASALLAKVYLYMEQYADARAEAEKVINSGEFKLYGPGLGDVNGKTYDDLYKTANNNNEESVIALQWAGGAPFGRGNSIQSSFAYSSVLTGTGDGYGVVGPTVDLQKAYEPGDERRYATIMLAGAYYPHLNQASGGYTVPSNVNAQDSRAALKKYVVGTPADNGGIGAQFSTGIVTYVMRYSEVLLIEAEAVLAGAQSTSDAAALIPFNKVRVRAGLTALPTLTRTNLMHERRIELAIESDYWFDLYRLDGWNGITDNQHPKAIAIIKSQLRGIYSANVSPVYYAQNTEVPDNGDFVFPYPTIETAQNPKLLLPPVPYDFK
jgi:hypothetical protein